MKKQISSQDLELWQVFENNNGHLSLVYSIQNETLYIINYNGSIYSVSKKSGSLTKYRKSDIKASEFLSHFPVYKFRNPKHENMLAIIIRRYNTRNNINPFDTDALLERKKAIIPQRTENYKYLLIL